ncbi:MAG: transcription factor [Candidatus Geothermarchaeales archaeon]
MIPSRIFLKLAQLYTGENGKSIVSYLLRKGEATDEDISRVTSLHVSEVRKILYELNTRAVVSSIREQDPDTGWITYLWYVPVDEIEGILYNIKRKVLERMEKRLEYETTNVFYWCGNPECEKLTFSKAVDIMFRCPKCGAHLKPYDNSELIAALNWGISHLRAELERHFA